MIHCFTSQDPGSTSLATALKLNPQDGPLLVLAPHDDDAVLGCGLTIQAAVNSGVAVHIAVVTDGRLGYINPSDRVDIVVQRRQEMLTSSACLGVDEEAVHFLDLPDGDLARYAGARHNGTSLEGLAVQLCALFRRIQPAVVLAPTPADLHPDHRVVTAEAEIACFHAQSAICRELGEPCSLPELYHYAVYCPFDREPTLLLRADTEEHERRLEGIRAFASQPDIIASLVERLQAAGPIELLAHRPWPGYSPADYLDHFVGVD